MADAGKTKTAALAPRPSVPQIEGHKFVEQVNPLREPNTPEGWKTFGVLTTSASIERGASPDVKKGMPQGQAPTTRERGAPISPDYNTRDGALRGLGSIFQYTNDGMPSTKTTCGQAAIATILTHYNIKPRDTGYTVVNDVYRRFAPDIAWGNLGTSWQQMNRALSAYGVPYNWYSGEAGLKNALNLYKPCIIMLDVGAIPEEGWGWGGHWVVAYAYDNNHIYLTNWNGNSQKYADGGKCTWAAFRKAWNAQLARYNGTANMFICPKG